MIAEKLLQYTASNAVLRAVNQGSGLIVFIVLFQIESKELFGQLLVFQALLMNFSILDLGLSTTLEKFIVKFRAERDQQKFNRSVTISVIVHLGIGCVAFLFFVALGSSSLLNWLGFNFINESAWVWCGIVAGGYWALRCFIPPLKGLGLFPKLNPILIESTIIGNVALVSAALVSDQLVVLILARYSPELYCSFRQFSLLRKSSSWAPRWRGCQLNGFWRFSGWQFVIRLASQVVNEFDKVLVSVFLGSQTVPIYYGIMRILRLPIDVNQVLKSAVIPVASLVHESDSKTGYKNLVHDGTIQANVIFACFVMVIFLYAHELLYLLGGEELFQFGTTLEFALLASMPVAGRAFLSQTLIGTGEVIERQGVWAIFNGISYLLLLYTGLVWFSVEGGVIARPFNQILMLGVWVLMVLKFTKVDSKDYFKTLLQGQWPFLIAISLYIILRELTDNYSLEHIMRLVLILCSSCAAWVYIIDHRVKKFLVRKLQWG